MTAEALAEQLEVSERTIYRDIEALSLAGIPLYSEPGPGGGFELLDGYQTRLTGLTAPEVRALFLLHTFAPLTDLGLDQALKDALLKLSAALPAASRENAMQAPQRIHIATAQSTHCRSVIPHLETIQEAIWHDYTLRLTYRGYHRRSIDPYGLVSQSGTWYLVGASAGMIQAVCVAHIQAAEMTEQHFTRPTGFDLAAYWTEHTALINRSQVNGRGQKTLKKLKMRTGVTIYTSPQRGVRMTRARNKKNKFCLPRFTSVLLALSKSILEPCALMIAAQPRLSPEITLSTTHKANFPL